MSLRKTHPSDLTGMRFGRLTALEVVGYNQFGHKLWNCRCDCGRTKVIAHNSLIQGRTRSCGCLRSELASTRKMKGPKSLTGQKFGVLTVLDKWHYENSQYYWLCRCECGNTRYMTRKNLFCHEHNRCGCNNARYRLREKQNNAAAV